MLQIHTFNSYGKKNYTLSITQNPKKKLKRININTIKSIWLKNKSVKTPSRRDFKNGVLSSIYQTIPYLKLCY